MNVCVMKKIPFFSNSCISKNFLLKFYFFLHKFNKPPTKNVHKKKTTKIHVLTKPQWFKSMKFIDKFFFQLDPVSCLVALFKLYLEKLNPEIDYLWQKPRRANVNYCDNEWYEPRRVGHDMLECFMKLSICRIYNSTEHTPIISSGLL